MAGVDVSGCDFAALNNFFFSLFLVDFNRQTDFGDNGERQPERKQQDTATRGRDINFTRSR
jgi:hypothetical protein